MPCKGKRRRSGDLPDILVGHQTEVIFDAALQRAQRFLAPRQVDARLGVEMLGGAHLLAAEVDGLLLDSLFLLHAGQLGFGWLDLLVQLAYLLNQIGFRPAGLSERCASSSCRAVS